MRPYYEDGLVTLPVWPNSGNGSSTDTAYEKLPHPSPRRYEHVAWLINVFADTAVLDPFCGTGTTLSAAKNLGLAIGGCRARRAVLRNRRNAVRAGSPRPFPLRRMTSAARYYVAGIELVNTGGESCCACTRPAVGRSLSGHPICAAHAGMAAEKELAASRLRRAPLVAQQLARVQEKMAESTGESVPGDRQRGRNGGRGR